MTVARILAGKGRDVFSTQPHRTLHEVSRLLAEKGIGAVVVTSADGELIGIVSERDIMRAVAHGGAAALDDSVSRHMTSKVITAAPSTRIKTLMEQMTAGRFRHMPVLDGGRLVGLVSIGDVVKHHIAEIENEHRAMRDYIATA